MNKCNGLISRITNATADDENCAPLYGDGQTRNSYKLRLVDGFMGLTHALSAVAVFMILWVMAPAFFAYLTQGDNLAVVLVSVLVMGAGALMPDLDNTQSSAQSALGIFGQVISMFMRITSPVVAHLIHGRADNDLDNPHRQFYHTTVSSLLFGALILFLIHVGGLYGALGIAFIGVHIASCTFAKGLGILKGKNKGTVRANIISLIFSAIVVGAVYGYITMSHSVVNWDFVGFAFGIGWLIHILGDTLTTQGTPLLFPLKIKGKRWFNVRVLPIKTGGSAEVFFQIIFGAIIVVCLVIKITSGLHV